MSDRPDNADFLDDLYRSGSAEGPSMELDRRILDAAAAASRRRRRLGLPLAGLASAAVVVLAVGLLLRQPLPPLEGKHEPAAMAPAGEALAPQSRQPDTPPAERARQSLARDGLGSAAVSKLAETKASAPTAADAPMAVGDVVGEAEPAPPERSAFRQMAEQPAQFVGVIAESVEHLEVGVVVEDCEQPYVLPPGATVHTGADRLVVTVDETTFALVCEAGRWVRQTAPQSSR